MTSEIVNGVAVPTQAPDIRHVARALGVDLFDTGVSLKGTASDDLETVLAHTADKFGPSHLDQRDADFINKVTVAITKVYLGDSNHADFWGAVGMVVERPLPPLVHREHLARCVGWASVLPMMIDEHTRRQTQRAMPVTHADTSRQRFMQ